MLDCIPERFFRRSNFFLNLQMAKKHAKLPRMQIDIESEMNKSMVLDNFLCFALSSGFGSPREGGGLYYFWFSVYELANC